MYQCSIPPRIFLAIGVGLLIFSLVFGWICFSVPDWLQFYEQNQLKNVTSTNISQINNDLITLKKFGLWYKCIFSTISNDFTCILWKNDAPSFVRVAQVLIPFGLSLGCLSFLCAIIGFMTRRAFITTALFAALFAFLSFIFTTIGVTVFATESLVYVERLRVNNNENPRRWGMWLILPNTILSFLASICFILASIFNWCDYRSMQVTGILSHTVDKYGGSVFKAPSDTSNMTSAMKKQHSYLQRQMSSQDYPNTCYQLNGSNNNNNNSNSMSYPPPPSYGAPHNHPGVHNPAYQTTLGYSRPNSPMSYPHSNLDPYHPRHYMTENSEMEDLSRTSRSRRRSRSRRHSSHRSRSRSPRDSSSGGNNNNNNQDNTLKQPQFIPIPVPYYQPPPAQPQTVNQPSTAQTSNLLPNSTNNTQPVSYIIQPPKQHFIEEFIQPSNKPSNVLTYTTANKPSLIVSNPTQQPVYTIAYRTNNNGNVLASNILTGAATTTYGTVARNINTEMNTLTSDSDRDEREYYSTTKQRKLNKINKRDAWTWRKL